MSLPRSYSAGHFLFVLDGSPNAGLIRSVSGGAIKGQIIDEAPGSDLHRVKHVGVVEIEPMELELGMALSEPFIKWINDSWKKKFARRSGAIVHADFDLKERLAQEFDDALIGEITFPTLDGSSSDSSYLKVSVQPERCKISKRNGETLTGVSKVDQKRWLTSNFRLTLGDINCDHISKIDGWSVKQKIKKVYSGQARFPEIEPTGIEFPNLSFYTALDFADGFIKWHKEYVLDGGNDTKHELDGSIEFLADNLDDKNPLFTVTLEKVGIYGISIEKSQAGKEEIKRCRIDVYVESMSIKHG